MQGELPKQNDKGYKCYTCGKTLSNFRNIKRHIKDLHPVRQHKFSKFSKKTLPFPSKIPRVVQTDSGFDPFSTTSTSVSEKGVHEGPKQNDGKSYKCDACEKTFTKLKNLRWHQKVHKGPYKCETCGKSYTVMDYLKDHVKIVHEGQEKKCHHCRNTSYLSSAALWKHYKKKHPSSLHELRKTYPCENCEHVSVI